MRVAETARTAIEKLQPRLRIRPSEEEGAQLMEYVLLLALVAVVAIPARTFVGPIVAGYYTSAAGAFG
jgi:Flp pilus assembly pilin Flp